MHIILEGYRGSQAHGTYNPGHANHIDDIDLMRVGVASPSTYFGLKEELSKGTREIKDGQWDIVEYEVRKFIHLLVKQNPNVVGMLWLKPEFYTKLTDSGKLLIENRELFKSKACYHSFVGYSYGQLCRMEKFCTDYAYMGAKRKKLIEAHGFDSKCAGHLIRLMRMCIEFLETGTMNVYRDVDHEELMTIKFGGWTLNQVKNEAEKLFAKAKEVYEKCTWPDQVDLEMANDLCMRIVKMELGYV